MTRSATSSPSSVDLRSEIPRGPESMHRLENGWDAVGWRVSEDDREDPSPGMLPTLPGELQLGDRMPCGLSPRTVLSILPRVAFERSQRRKPRSRSPLSETRTVLPSCPTTARGSGKPTVKMNPSITTIMARAKPRLATSVRRAARDSAIA